MWVLLHRRKALTILLAFAATIGGAFYYLYHPSQSPPAEQASLAVTKPVVPEATPDFFVEYRLERDRLRSEKADVMREILQSATSDESRSKAQDAVVQLVVDKQKETEVENLLKGRGFSDALVLIRDQAIQIIVKAPTLTKEDVLQISHIVKQVTGVKEEQIQISAKP